ncbi:lysoplasmalogenase family protein [Streptacidiphilus carbonis]|uniref:lysoplasmalogenase family protein n=1 Tax=Streptacidiphilus carbonis TaxID=105422 RepID=UPI0005A940F9|nr:lysoplasmalogenase family protein [Streptacidiphilus carbonis]
MRLRAYAGLSVAHLVFILLGWGIARDVSKPLLMLLLAAAVAAAAPRLLLGALLASCAGDTFLIFGGTWFLLGMGGFAVAHACYVTRFVRGGALRDRRRLLRTAVPYAVAWAVLITLLWPDLDAGLRIPLACYSLLLTGTAVTSGCAGLRTGLGGGLFLLSDSLIASALAHWPQPPAADFWVMLTYLVGQYLLATGIATAYSARSTTTGAWSEVPLPLRASRST